MQLRAALAEAAVTMARAAGYRSLGTLEFLVETGDGRDDRFAFIEANGRLQVEHTVTEEVTGVDLVQLQLELAQGATLASLGFTAATVPAPRGVAIQARVNLETMRPDGTTQPVGRRVDGVRASRGAGPADRHVRLCRLRHQPELRLAARQGHHVHAAV